MLFRSANLCPEVTAKITAACLRGDYETAAAMQKRYMALIDALFCEVNPIPVKTAMNLMGLGVGPLRMPLCELDDGKKEQLISVLHQKNLI